MPEHTVQTLCLAGLNDISYFFIPYIVKLSAGLNVGVVVTGVVSVMA